MINTAKCWESIHTSVIPLNLPYLYIIISNPNSWAYIPYISSHIHLYLMILNNPQTQGMRFICEASRTIDHVEMCSSHLNPNPHPQASNKLGGLVKTSQSLSKTLIGWWVPFENTSKFIWSPKDPNPLSWPSLACTNHGSPWILTMSLRTPKVQSLFMP